ncbi:MAG TPA: hypothetical protein VFS00_33240, partial [Polyangiaceae bacterium]|nr:hypothetical protein [Polyangiaceae bacterium]
SLRTTGEWAAIGRGAGFDPSPALDALSRLLDGPAEGAERLVTGDAPARAGRVLFEALFASAAAFEAVLRALLARPGGPAPDPAEQPVRVRIVTSHPVLLGLPWRLTASAGQRLADLGWTFEVTHEQALRPGPPSPLDRTYVVVEGTGQPPMVRSSQPSLRNVYLPAAGGGRPPRVLVIAPAAYRGVPMQTDAHVRALRARLAAIGVDADDAERLNVVRTRFGLQHALRRRPDVVYYYGAIEAPAGAACLVLAGPTGGEAYVPLAEVAAWMRPAPPLVVYLNAHLDDADAWRAAVLELAGDVPLVVANRTRAWSDAARATAIAWLVACLSTGDDPVVAVHAAGATEGLYRAAATLHTAYDRWATEAPALPPARFEIAWRRALEAQRAAVRLHAYCLFRSPVRRVLALLAPAPPPSFGEPDARPFVEELALTCGDLGGVRTLRVPFPRDGDASPEALKRALLEALDATNTVEQALRRLTMGAGRPMVDREGGPTLADAPGERTLVWLDGGTFGGERRPSPAELLAWLELGAEVLAPSCPAEVRVVVSLSLRVDPAKHA